MKRPQRILIVDGDPESRAWLSRRVEHLGHAAEAVHTGEEALAIRERERPDLVILDAAVPGLGGLQTLKAFQTRDPGLPVIVTAAQASTRAIVTTLRAGARDFLAKPIAASDLDAALARALDNPASPAGGGSGSSVLESRLFLGGEKMHAVRQVVERVADTDITVLIRGESGTGKECVAQLLYEGSRRRRRPFVKINCAALPAQLLESELFGYEKGAFTGAQKRKLGKFELAHDGTIFLDEISEMHPGLQAKLLQVLQDGQFSRLGGEADVKVDARILAATNRDLETAVREGTFREDLFYRLNVVAVQIPPLRERVDEIPSLTETFLRRGSREYSKEFRPASESLLAALCAYRWPGNVRELENLCKRLVVFGSEEAIVDELHYRSGGRLPAPDEEPEPRPRGELEKFMRGEIERVDLKKIGREAARDAEKRLIEKVLQRTRWNRKQAAEILQISYKALLYKMKDAGLGARG